MEPRAQLPPRGFLQRARAEVSPPELEQRRQRASIGKDPCRSDLARTLSARAWRPP